MKRMMMAVAVASAMSLSPAFADPEPTSAEKTAVEEANAEEKESPLSFEATLDFYSSYMWRGIMLCDAPVWQPGATVSYSFGDYGTVSANVWASFGMHNHAKPGKAAGCQEIDYTLSYEVDVGDFTLGAGHIWYTYPKYARGSSDQDVYASVAYNGISKFFTPSATLYWNYLDSCGTDPSSLYASFVVSRDFEVMDKLTITPSATFGLGDNAYTGCGFEPVDFTVGVSASYAINDHFTVGACINYTMLPSHELRAGDYMGYGEDQRLWGGVNLAMSF